MSFLDKLHRNDNALDVRPEAELKKLFGRKKGKEHEREQAEQQDNNAADRLVNVALNSNPIDAAAKAIVGGADPIAPLTKKVNELAAPITDKANDVVGKVNEVTNAATNPVGTVLEHVARGSSSIIEGQDAATDRADKGTERGNELRQHVIQDLVGKATEVDPSLAQKKSGGIHASVGGFEINIDAKAALDDKKPALGGGISIDGNGIHAEASTDNALAKNAKVDTSAQVGDTKLGGKPDAKADGPVELKADAKLDAKADAKADDKADEKDPAKAKLVDDGKVAAKGDGETKADGQPDAAGPAERMAKVAVDNAERETKGDGKGQAADGGGAKGVADPGHDAPAGGGKVAKGIAATKSADVQAQVATDLADAPVVSKPNSKLGPGGKSLATATSRAAKNVVGRWGQNLDGLDIGPDPEIAIDMADAPGMPEDAGADSIEIGIPGVTLPKMTPKMRRAKIAAKLGHGDWHAAQSKGVEHATQTVEARGTAATDHGDALAHGSGSMAKSHVDHDAQTASGLTAAANRPPDLVAKRGGRKPQAAKPKQTVVQPAVDAKDKQPHADKQPDQKKKGFDPSGMVEQIDGLVDEAKAGAPAFASQILDTFTKAIDPAGGLAGNEMIKKVADPATRAMAAMKGVPADKRSSVLGRLDAVAAVGTEQAQHFVDQLHEKHHEAAGDHSTDAAAVGSEDVGKEGGKRKKGEHAHEHGGASIAGQHGQAVADSYLQHHARDGKSLRQIQDKAFADLDVTPLGAAQKPKADLSDPQVWDAIGDQREQSTLMVSDERPMQPQQKPGDPQPAGPQQMQHPTKAAGQQSPHQTAATAEQQAHGLEAQHGAKTAQHAQHARNREQEAKQRAEGRKKQADQDKKAREAALEKEAPAQKAKMRAELTAHKDLALQVLTMNKEQLQAEYDKRLKTDVQALQEEIKKSKEDVTKSWADQKPKAQAANVKAKADIDKFCNGELKTIDGQLKTLSQQLKTNPEKAAKTAEEQGKDDCDRYADTRDGNIERIRASAKEAAEEQRRLGAEAYRIGMARAERQTDEPAKANAKKDAESQKSHFETQANKLVTDGETKAATEKKKYDDLIAKRTESYKTTARNIREKGVGYLDEMKQSFEQAKRDIEKLREDSKKQADAQLKLDIDFIEAEIRDEMRRLELKLEDRERELRTEIKYALASMANLTEDQKKKMREDIEKAHTEACARIDAAKANELNAMQLQLADCHSRIDQALGPIGTHTVKAVRQLAAFRQDYGEQVENTVGSIKSRAEQAERAQGQIAQTAATTSAKIRSGAMDSVAGMNAEQLGKRDQWSDYNAQQEAFKKQQVADAKRATDRASDMALSGNANHQKAVDQKLDATRRSMGEAVGGYGINPDMSKVMQEMAKLSPEELEQLFKGPKGEELKKRLDELSKPGWVLPPTISPSDIQRMQEMQKAGTPEQVKAQVIDWCFNGGFTGAGYDDKTFKEVMKGMSPQERAEVDKAFKEKTGKTIGQEIDDEAWFSGQNNKMMNAHLKSDAAAIAEEKWQAAEGGFFRGVKDFVDNVPGGRVLTDPVGSLAREVGPVFGFKAPDHPLDTLAGFGMNQDAYIAQTDRIRELTEPPPGASAAEVSAYLQKRREMMREIDQWLGDKHGGLTLEKMDNSEANDDYNRVWMKNNDATTFRNMLDAGRTGDWATYSNNKAAYSAETTLGNRNWLKEEIEHRSQRGEMAGLRTFLGQRSEDGKFESFIDANIPQAVDRGYFKAIGEDPPPERGSVKWRQLMANKLLYAQFGGRTGWGDDRAEMEKVIQSLSKEELDALRGEYSKLSGQYGLTMENDSNKAQMLTNPVGFFFLGNWSTGKLDSDMYLSYGGYMHDMTGGVIGKGEDYAMMEYDLKHGKPQTPEEMRDRAKFKHDFNTSSGLFNMLRENGIYDSRGWMGKFADDEYAQLEASYQKLKAAGVAHLPLTDPRVLALPPEQLAELAQFQFKIGEAEAWDKSANANTRMMVDGIVTIVTTTVTIITTAAITILTAGTATPFLVAALMAAGGAAMAGLAGMGVKIVCLGGAYGGNEAKMDFANLVIDSLVAGVTAGQGISNFAGKIVGKLGISAKLAQEVLTELIQNAIQSGADLTKFLMDESLYQGSPEEVLAKIRKKSLQLGASTVLSSAAGVSKHPVNGAWLQTTIQSAVSYDPDQPPWGQFLNYASGMASAIGTEAATKWGTHVSEKHFGKGGMHGPSRDANGIDRHAESPEAHLPANGMRTRADGIIEVTSPEIAHSLAEQAKAGKGATVLDGSPPRYRIDTPNGPVVVEVPHGHTVKQDGTPETPVVAKKDEANTVPQRKIEEPAPVVKKDEPDPALAKTEQLPAVVKKDEADPALAKTEQHPLVKKDEVDPALAKTEQLPAVVKKDEADPALAKTEQLPAVVKKDEADPALAKTEQLPAVVKKDEPTIEPTVAKKEDPAAKLREDANATLDNLDKQAAVRKEEAAPVVKKDEEGPKLLKDDELLKTKKVDEPAAKPEGTGTTEMKAVDPAAARKPATDDPAEILRQAVKDHPANQEAAQKTAKHANEVPALDNTIDSITGVKKGPEHDAAMQRLRDAAEVINVQSRFKELRVDQNGNQIGYYNIGSAFEARRLAAPTGDVMELTVKVHLNAANKDANGNSIIPANHAEIQKLMADTHAGVDEHYNNDARNLKFPNGDRMRVRVEFVSDPALAHLTVDVRPGGGGANQTNWYVDSHGAVHAHELGHQLGLVDEYHDQRFQYDKTTGKRVEDNVGFPKEDPNWNKAIGREKHDDQRVSTDKSLMGDFWMKDAAGNQIFENGQPKVDPRVGLRDRHLEQIFNDVQGQKQRDASGETGAKGRHERSYGEVAAPAPEVQGQVPNAPLAGAAKTPKELAQDQQKQANVDRDNAVSDKDRAKFKEIDQLATIAKTRADWEYIRSLEAQAKRPVSERFSHDDEQASLQAVTRTQGEDAVPQQRKDEVAARVKEQTAAHDKAVKELTADVQSSIKKKDDSVTGDIVKKANETEVVGGRKEISVDAAISLGMGGAGAAGAHGDKTGKDSTTPRKDRIGIEDATRPELWNTLGSKPMGQEATAISYGTGGVRTSDVAEHGTAKVATAGDMALQVAAQRDSSGVGTVGSLGPVGPLEYKKVTIDGKTVLEVGVPTRIQTGTDSKGNPIIETVLIKTTQGVDISTGMGQARELLTKDSEDGSRKQQISEKSAKALKERGQMMSGEQALAMDASSFHGERVLGIGGGPTSVWAMEHALSGGATSATIAGQMPRPKGELGKRLVEVETQIRDLVKNDQPVPKELTDKHHAIITEHVMNQKKRLAELDAKLADEKHAGRAREKDEAERARLAAELDPFSGSRVDRNHAMLNSDKMVQVQADVIKVRPIQEEGGHWAVEVTFGDGTKRVVDRVVPSIGADPDAPGGIHQMLKNAPADMQLIPVISEGRVVGLESNPPGISVSGAAMVGTLGHNMPPEVLKRIPAEMRDAVIASLIDHAYRKGVSAGSRGIVPGIENVGSNTQLTIEAIKRIPPDERSAELQGFLLKHDLKREAEFGGDLRFHDQQPKSGSVHQRVEKLEGLELQSREGHSVKERDEAKAKLEKLKRDPEWQDAWAHREAEVKRLEALEVLRQQEGHEGVARQNQEKHDTRNWEIHLGDDVAATAPTEHEQHLRGELNELNELREKLRKAKPEDQGKIKDDIAKKQGDLDTLINNPDNRDALLDPHVAFALAREANYGDRSSAVHDFLRSNIDAFRRAQDQGRQGVDPQLRAKREVFEREIAKAVLANGPVKKRVDDALDVMCAKALEYITKSRSGIGDQDKAFAALGLQASSGLAGAVLTDTNPARNAEIMREVLKSGNVRERMIALGKFAEFIANDMLNNPHAFESAKSGAGEHGMSEADFKAYQDRMTQFLKDKGYKPGDPLPKEVREDKDFLKDFLKPTKDEKTGQQSEYQANKGQEMDTKIPSLATHDKHADEDFFLSTALTGSKKDSSVTGMGEGSTMAKTTITVAEAEAMGYRLSPRELEAAAKNNGRLPWVVGTVANVVDPSADFIKAGTAASLPQKAGISGTTFRFMEAANLLGGDPQMSRLAMVGALQTIDAHTVYEIASASKGFGLEFNPQRPYDHLGLSREELADLAKRTGAPLAELNGETTAPKKEGTGGTGGGTK